MKLYRKQVVVSVFVFLVLIVIYKRSLFSFDFGKLLEKGKEEIGKVVGTVEEEVKKVTGAIEDVLTDQVKKQIRELQRAVRENPYKDTIARVRVGNQLPLGERNYLQKRKPKVKVALEQFLERNLTDKYIPTIAFIGSGGGYRAMICTTGFLAGAQKIGLLNAVTYMTALSGSTWALGAWFASGRPVDQFRDWLAERVGKDIKEATPLEIKLMVDAFLVKIGFDQPMTLVDLYGALLANRLLADFGDNRQMVYLSKQMQRVRDGDWIFPIYTAVDGREAVAANPPWFEYTPFEVGSAEFGAYIPTWAFGRKFDAGKSIDFAPEQSLGYNLGTFGSAFAVHFGLAWEEITEKIKDNIAKQVIEQKVIQPIAGKRLSWAEVRNFMKGMAGQQLSGREKIKFVDAGLGFNLPYPPVSGERAERKADIMVFFDASASVTGARELQKTESYARRKGLKFPKIDYTNIDKRVMSIFKDEKDPAVPVVIYMPRIKDVALWEPYKSNIEFIKRYLPIIAFDVEHCVDKGFCSTMNFAYTRSQASLLMLVTEFNMVASEQKIKAAINWVIDQKSR